MARVDYVWLPDGWEVEILLDAEERRAVTDLIRLLAKGKMRGETDGRKPEAGKKIPDDGGGNVVKFGPGSKRDRMVEDALPVDTAADQGDR